MDIAKLVSQLKNKSISGVTKDQTRVLKSSQRVFVLCRDFGNEEESSENRRDRLQCRRAVFPRYQPNAWQYRRLANNYLTPPSRFTLHPSISALFLSFRSFEPCFTFPSLSICEEILIREEGAERKAQWEEAGVSPSLDFRQKIYRSGGLAT